MRIVDQQEGQGWVAYHGDAIDVVRNLPDASVGHSIFSPPFASLYCYSSLDRDMGNATGGEKFAEHFAFLLPEIFRVLKPGRSLSMHCMDLPASKQHDGFIGLKDFRGELIRAGQDAGFIYHSCAVIWKDPVIAMQRTKALGLLHKTIRKDSSMSRVGLPDYLVTLRKPGQNTEFISNDPADFPVQMWQRFASPIWDRDLDQSDIVDWMERASAEDPGMSEAASLFWRDINPSDTLQFRSAREHDDERHICLAAGSLVLTREHGYLEIEDVEPGDHVLTHMGRWRPVLAKRCNGIAETIRTCAQGVADLRTTPDHRLWTRVASGSQAKASARESAPTWEEARTVLGSYLNLQLPPEEPSKLTPEEWWIVGRWLGDGHRGSRRTSGARGGGLGQFTISCGHHEVDDLVARLGVHAGFTTKGTATQINIIGLRSEVREVLDRCGIGASNKRLPGEAVALPPEESEALLSGYLSADGHHTEKYDRLTASSVSRGLLLGMAMVTQRCRSVVASVYAGRPDREGEIQGRLVHMCQEWLLAFRNSDGYRKSGWIDDLGAWKKVRRIEDAGEAEVWDLQVEEDASFTAEGCVVHNCPLQLEVIRRSIRLWSNPGDVILTPFGGIGSEGVVALEMGRRAVLAELKASYFKQLSRNMRIAEKRGNTPLGELFAAASADDGDSSSALDPDADPSDDSAIDEGSESGA